MPPKPRKKSGSSNDKPLKLSKTEQEDQNNNNTIPLSRTASGFQVQIGRIPNLSALSAAVLAIEIEKDPSQFLEALRDYPANVQTLIFQKLSYVALDKFAKDKGYADVLTGSLLSDQMKKTEDHFRHLFATNRESPEIQDSHLMLIDVFENADSFVASDLDEEEKKLPRLFAIPPQERLKPGTKVIVTPPEFQRNWDIFTERQLRGINWKNVFAAGGSVLACLDIPPPNLTTAASLRKYYLSGGPKEKCGKVRTFPYRSSDIDLFIYGLNPKQATEKARELYEIISDNVPFEMGIVRTAQSITFVSEFPYRHIQIILRCYKSPAEILMGFDLDSVTCGYDGEKVWALPRFFRCLTKSYNLVDPDRRSTTYESRLMKYGLRGFEAAVPGLDVARVDPQIFKQPVRKTRGLARLLKLDAILKDPKANWAKPYASHDPDEKIKDPPYIKNFGLPRKLDDPRCAEYEASWGVPATDYFSIFLPWQPGYSFSRISTLLEAKTTARGYCFEFDWSWSLAVHGCNFDDVVIKSKSAKRILESEQEDSFRKPDPKLPKDYYEITDNNRSDWWYLNFGTKEGSEAARGNDETDCDEFETHKVLTRVPVQVKWLTQEPGRQYIGSFKPEDPTQWEEGVYCK